MGAPCPFINCAVKKRGIEFCWLCNESKSCERLKKNREFAKAHDTATCYQKIEDNAQFIQKEGIEKFEQQQKTRENLLSAMLAEFNEGRSKSLYCVAATVMEPAELEAALDEARKKSKGMNLKQRAEIMHSTLSKVAADKNYVLKLRK
jgi:predicted ATP-binding protein involved in virulence